jgi:hypothetical protein
MGAGWVQSKGDFAAPFIEFWFLNFGLWLPLALLAVGLLWYRGWQSLGRGTAAEARPPTDNRAEARSAAITKARSFLARLPTMLRSSPALAFITPAALLFLFAALVKTAPWEWDNIKIFIWAYLIALPFLWSELIARWPLPVRIGLCIALFGSGFVSLFGGLLSERQGFGLADRAELDAVGHAVQKLPAEARFAAFPTYNHLLLLQGRKMVLGYPGHLWTQGFDYAPIQKKLEGVMRGAPDWRQKARELNVQYLFWGKEEKTQYAGSTRPWEREARLVASGSWGAIYDVEHTAPLPTRTSVSNFPASVRHSVRAENELPHQHALGDEERYAAARLEIGLAQEHKQLAAAVRLEVPGDLLCGVLFGEKVRAVERVQITRRGASGSHALAEGVKVTRWRAKAARHLRLLIRIERAASAHLRHRRRHGGERDVTNLGAFRRAEHRATKLPRSAGALEIELSDQFLPLARFGTLKLIQQRLLRGIDEIPCDRERRARLPQRLEEPRGRVRPATVRRAFHREVDDIGVGHERGEVLRR